MSETKRKILIIIVLGLVILFGVGQFFAYSNINNSAQNSSSTTSGTTNTLPTQVVAYVPAVPISALPVEQGSCFASSVAAPYRADAWRCTVGNAISDPCFEIPGATSTLLCGANPATSDTSSTFILQLTKKLPAPTTPSGVPPTNWAWLVQLGDGTLCTPFTGTRPFTASGDVGTYSCNNSVAGESMIFGDLNNASTTWFAEVGSLSTATSTFPPVIIASATVPVAAVWQ